MTATDKVTLGELRILRTSQCKKGLKISEWKILVKKFATKHNLTDREAIELSHIARDLPEPPTEEE